MPSAQLDHIVIGAASLEQGVAWAHSTLGVSVPVGGRHEKMATHNRVMSLGADRYLEIIAIDPRATSINRPRWFGLDDPQIERELALAPRLLTWAINTDDIHAAVGNLDDRGINDYLTTEAMSRDSLNWQVCFAKNGNLVDAGLFPLMLQWRVSGHPSRLMDDLDCTLTNLEVISTNIDALRIKLSAIGALQILGDDRLREGEVDELVATLQTPLGERRLSSRSVHLED